MSADEFYASAPVPAVPFAPVPVPVSAPPAGAAARFPLWKVVAGVAVALALLVGLGIATWPHSSGSTGPDPAMARLFGQQTHAQLPQPVQADDCAAAVHAFPAIARDAAARAAFVDGCLHP